METSVTANMLVPPQSDMACSSLDDETSDGEMAAAACCSSSDLVDPMLEFSRRLQDIISTYGDAAALLDTQIVMEAETERMDEKDGITVTMETDISLIMHSLNSLSSPEEKLKDLVTRYAEMAALRRSDEKKLYVLQQKLSTLLDEKQQLQAERRSSATARVELETLCRELQCHYSRLREETLQRCREDEEKRKEITCHFQKMLTEIQAQIEQHSTRNDKLCRENANLTDKLESLMNQCEMREESLEKINRHRDLQHKLTEAKLQQANALLTEAEEKHKREKEYLLREAIDKTKKCFAMKEQELAMKKKLTLYAQKFDEFQATLAKSNEIYARFKKEMDNMTDRMKKMEKESNLWKTRFENCNKALTDMIEERTEKGKEYDLFVLKIQRLEKLCRALQEERKVLYDKIKEVRHSNTNLSNLHSSSDVCDVLSSEAADKCALLKPEEIQDLQDQDPVLTQDMTRLREEQAKLQEFAASLLTTPTDNEEEDNDCIDLEDDVMASAFIHFKTKTRVKEEPVSVPEKDVNVKAEVSDLPLSGKVEEVQKADVSTPIAPTPEVLASEGMSTQPKPEVAQVQTQVEGKEVQHVKPEEQQPSEQQLTSEAEKVSKVVSVVPTEDKQLQLMTEPVQVSEEAPTISVSASENMPTAAADSAKMQAPKKKKKKSSKNSS